MRRIKPKVKTVLRLIESLVALEGNAMKASRKRLWFALLLLAGAASTASAIDWGSAGAGSASKPGPGQVLAAPKLEDPALPDGSFDCDTVTRMSWEQQRTLDGNNRGPRQVKRCSRDGLSIEVTPPST